MPIENTNYYRIKFNLLENKNDKHLPKKTRYVLKENSYLLYAFCLLHILSPRRSSNPPVPTSGNFSLSCFMKYWWNCDVFIRKGNSKHS